MEIGDEEKLPFYDGGKILLGDLKQYVLDPVLNTNILHDTLIPPKLLFAVYGRSSMQKARAIHHFCIDSKAFHAVHRVKVEYRNTITAVDNIQTFMDDSASIPHMKKVIIIDAADEFVLRPENELTKLFLLHLQETAYKTGTIIFACFNKDPLRELQGIHQSIRDFRIKVMSYFNVFFFVPQPSSTYRKECLETLLTQGVEHLNNNGSRKIELQLSDVDYANLDTYTCNAGPLEIWKFTQAVLYDAAFQGREKNPHNQDDEKIVITLDVLRTYMNSKAGRGLHILDFDPRYQESDMMVACDKGTLDIERDPREQKARNQQQMPVMKKEPKSVIKRGIAPLEEEEEGGGEDKKRIKLEEKLIEEAFDI